MIFTVDPVGNVTCWSSAAERLTSYRASEVVGRSVALLDPPDEAAPGALNGTLQGALRKALAEGRCEETVPLLDKDGTAFRATATLTALFDRYDEHVGFSVVLRETGGPDRGTRDAPAARAAAAGGLAQDWARRRAEGELRSERVFADTMIESMPGVVYLYDANGRFLRWNRNFESVSGFTADEIARKHPLDFFADADRPLMERRIAEALESGQSAVEADFLARDGTTTPYLFTGRRVQFDGAPCLVGVGIDVSEHRRAEDRVAESERRYRELVEHANSIILRWNAEGRVTLLNEFGQRFFGYTSEEIVGRHVTGTIVPPTESGGRDLRRLMQEICEAPQSFDHSVNENMRRNGERVWVAWTNRVVRDSEGGVVEILSIGTDVTERRRADEARRESEALYRKLFDYAPDGIVISTPDGHYVDANASMCRMLGRPRDEVIGLHASDIVVGDEVEHIRPTLDALGAAADHHREWRIRRADGSVFHADVIATLLPDGNFLGMLRDVTERRQAEAERERRHRAEAADRIKSAFLATMSHELRTPLNSILGFTGIVLQELPGPLNAEQRKQLEMVRTSARHLLALVNDVLDISKIEAGQLVVGCAPFDLRKSIAKVVGLVAPQAEAKGLALRSRIEPDLGAAAGDERRFEQILLNLLSNAVKFTDRGEVSLAAERVAAPGPGGAGDAADARPAVRVRVSDTGIGISEADLATLFQPFRQVDSGLSRRHEGTGLGLAICRRLATLMGGDIRAESALGGGSTFIVTLPVEAPPKS